MNDLALCSSGSILLEKRLVSVDRIQSLGSFLSSNSMQSPNARIQLLPGAIAAAEKVIASGELERVGQTLKEARQPASNAAIGAHLAKLIASFPNSTRAPLKVYGEALAEDGMDAAPSLFALQVACRRLRRTCKFLPTIAEILEAIGAEESRLRWAGFSIERFPKNLEDARFALR